jgi:hypothetical protein
MTVCHFGSIMPVSLRDAILAEAVVCCVCFWQVLVALAFEDGMT